MNKNIVYSAGTILAAVFLAGCFGEVSAPDEPDPLARDSVLSQQIVFANQAAALADEAVGDTNDVTAEVDDVEFQPEPPATAAEIRALLEPPPPPVTIARAALPPAVVVAERARAAKKPVESARRQPEVASTPPAAAATPVEIAPAPAPDSEPSLVTVPTGTDLFLAASRRVCVNTSRVGDRFRARLRSEVEGIPSEATATVQITSLVGRMGEEDLVVDVRSINVDGRTYSIDSRVRRIELDRTPGAYRCIPDEGRITAELTGPLRVRQ